MVQEGMLSMSMAQIYRRQSMYAEVKKKLYEREILVMRTAVKRREEEIT